MRTQVTNWPKNLHGKFFNGDSYIILNTYKEPGSYVSFSVAYPCSSLWAQRSRWHNDIPAHSTRAGAQIRSPFLDWAVF